MSYTIEKGTFQVPAPDGNSSGLTLAYQRWIPGNPKPGHDMIWHHGLGEHCNRCDNVLGALEGSGITLYSYDIRGHGVSEGKRGLAAGIGELADDLALFLQCIQKDHGVTRPLLWGHSMGGATALHYAGATSDTHRDSICAVVITAPALGVERTLYQTVMSTALLALQKIVPKVCLPSGLNANNLSRDPNAVEAYKKDPLTHDLISVSLAFSILNGGKSIIDTAPTMTLPLFMAHGEADKITAPFATKEYFQKCGSPKKTLMLYPGMMHELHNEPKEDREKVLKDITSFIVEQLDSK